MSTASEPAIKRQLIKIANIISIFLLIGGSFFIISVINTKDVYLKLIAQSQKEYSAQILFVANAILNVPVQLLFVVIIFVILGKEFYLHSTSVKLKINLSAAIFLLLLDLLVVQIISYPAVN